MHKTEFVRLLLPLISNYLWNKIAYKLSREIWISNVARIMTLTSNLIVLLNLSKEWRTKFMSKKLLKSNAPSHLELKGVIIHISQEVILVKREWNRGTFSPPHTPWALIFTNWHFVNPMLIVSILVHGPIRPSYRITKYPRKRYQ